MAYSSLVSLAQATDLILIPYKYSISVYAKETITSIREYTNFLISLIVDRPEKANRLEGRMRDVANKAEDIIESWWSVALSKTYIFEQQLKKVSEEIGSIAEDMMDHQLRESPAVVSSSRLAYTGKSDMVIGLDEELIAIKHRLCGESSKLEFIPILGMGGIGKTTLARYAYDDRLTVEHFRVRAWITISQDYTARDILSCLQDSMKLFEGKILPHEYEITMKKKVYQYLKGRRYLIVMDDVWGTKVLDDVRHIFPNDYNGSRIMLTTRLSDVATYAGCPVHEMKFMDDDQCWNLLKQKVFTNGNGQVCPSKLEDVGKHIARSCSGLPLAVVLVAGVLCKVAETPASWEKIAKNVNSVVGETLENVLSLSYTHLPHHLRSCLLYMGGFPEDHEIRASKVIKLWVAEGFLKRTNKSKSLEEEAEEYLEDLVERSLVLMTNRKSNGKIKSCGLHDLVRDLCIRKAREEKFLAVVHGAYGFEDVRRLSITNSDNLNDIYWSDFRTVLCFQGLEASYSGLPRFLGRSKLLRVLDVAKGSYIPSQIFEFFNLRYLALQTPVCIPQTISKLEHLRTLIINQKANRICQKLPLEIWRLPQLQHLVVYYLDLNLDPADGSTLPLENLQTLLEVKADICSEKFLKMVPNVKKLGLIFDDTSSCLYNLTHLGQLEKLKVTRRRGSYLETRNLTFPRTLKKLTLSNMQILWKDMTIVGLLPNLEVLKLINNACDGDTWETTDGEFPQLKFLLIERSTLRNWKTECSHFPSLKFLILHLCWSLSQVPDSIIEIPSLEMIEVDYWNKLLVKSAKEMQEDQQCNGSDALQVRLVGYLHKNRFLEESNGKICYMIGARELHISRSDDPQVWEWEACAESRFSEVAELIEIYNLDISVKIETEMLSSNTTYAAYLVFKLAKASWGLESVKANVEFDTYAEKRSVLVHLQQRAGAGPEDQNGRHPVWRDDGWMEVELGTFYNHDGGGEVKAWLWRWNYLKSGLLITGLIIEGIEFRPKT